MLTFSCPKIVYLQVSAICFTFVPHINRKQNLKQTTAKYMKWLLPALFIVYYSSISLFMHVHVEYGTTIVHSHPFKKAADGVCHQHSSLSEIQLFHLLTTVQVQDGAVRSLLLSIFTTPSYKIIENPVYSDHLLPVVGKFFLRAPPFGLIK